MNVQAITQPSEIGAGSKAAEQAENSSGIGDFSNSLRGAIGDEGATESAQTDSETPRDQEEEASKRFAESETPAEQGNASREEKGEDAGQKADPDADAGDRSTAEEQAAESAQAAAETGALGEMLAGRQTAARVGLEFSEAEAAEGAPSALDSNRRQAAGGRAILPGEGDAALESQSRGTSGATEGQTGVDANALEGATTAGSADRSGEASADLLDGREANEAGRVAQPAQQADAATVSSTGTIPEATDGNGERASEIAAAPTAAAEAQVSRDDEPSGRADAGADGGNGQGASQGDREGANESRDFAEQQANAEERPSLADGEANLGVAAEAAAAYAAAASNGNVRAEEAVPVEGGIAVAGAAAATAPETASAPTAPTANAPQPAAASDAIAVQTEWLATRGGGSARLRLNPAELGEIEIRVSVRGGVVEVVMVAQEAVTQALAEEQGDRLAQAFASRDLRMDGFDVRRGDPNASANDANGEFAQSSQQGEDRNGQGDAAGSGREGAAAGPGGGGAASSAPAMPQILVTGPEASVDLRI